MKILLKDTLKHLWKFYIALLTINIYYGLSVSINILLTENLINSVINLGDFVKNLMFIVLFNLSTIIIVKVEKRIHKSIDFVIDIKIGKKISEIAFDIPYKHYENQDTYQTIEMVNNDYKKELLTPFNTVFTVVMLLFASGSILIYLFNVQWYLPIIVVVLMIPILFLYNKYSMIEVSVWRDNYPLYRKFQYFSSILTTRNYSKETRVFKSYDFVTNRWEESIRKWQDNIMTANLKPRFTVGTFYALQYIVIAVIIFFMIAMLDSGAITIGLLISLSGALFSFIQIFPDTIGDILRKIKSFLLFKKNYEKYLDLNRPKIANKFDNKEAVLDKLVFKNVWFRYENSSEYIIKGASFTIQKDEKIAFVGMNGSGKTTLIKLLIGLLVPEKGEITVNGIDIKDLSQSDIKNIFSVAFQDFVKFDLTLKENIQISNLNKPCEEDDIRQILEFINNQSMIIDKLDKGIDTILGKNIDGGIDVSEGNWQTIAIARAVFSDSPFLILDEPTASLDPVAEVEVYKQLLASADKKTAVFITHRLGATTSVDKIFVINDGAIVESGSHENLMNEGGLYAKMFNTQKQWYK